MARGLPGAFGRKVNSPAVWIPLMLAFFVPFFDWRRPFRLLHLDLLVLLAFSVSHVFFNRGEIFTSVPLVYPVLVYLLVRMLMLAYARRRRRRRSRCALLVPADAGSALALDLPGRVPRRAEPHQLERDRRRLLGRDRRRPAHRTARTSTATSRTDNPSGDTYGPVNYYAYVPFELAFPWSGRWDDLPAAHAAAIFFDLAHDRSRCSCVGRRLRAGRGTATGSGSCSRTPGPPIRTRCSCSNSNANDSPGRAAGRARLPARWRSPRRRGARCSRLRRAAKFAPLALAPLFASYDRAPPARRASLFALAFAAVLVLVFAARAARRRAARVLGPHHRLPARP